MEKHQRESRAHLQDRLTFAPFERRSTPYLRVAPVRKIRHLMTCSNHLTKGRPVSLTFLLVGNRYTPAAAIELGTSKRMPVTMHGKADRNEKVSILLSVALQGRLT